MERNKIIGTAIFWGGITIMALAFYLKGHYDVKRQKNKILEKYTIVKGIVREYSSDGAKHGSSVKYSFGYNNELYYASSSGSSFFSEKYFDLQSFLIGKSFPVILSVKDPTLNQILIIPEDFELYNIPFPDSLQWVKEKLGD